MARIRSVKPELRSSEVVASWPFEVRYFFVLLWGYLDDKGRCLDVPKAIAGDCFPHDNNVTAKKIDTWLDIIAESGPVCRYQANGRRYLHTINAAEHQKPNRPTPSRLPPCPLHEPLTESRSEPLTDPPDGGSVPGIRQVVDVDGAEELEKGTRDEPRDPTPAKGKRGTRIPDNFEPDPELIAWARQHAPDVGRRDHQEFCDYWAGVPGQRGVKLDWPATWRNWMSKQQRQAEERANRGPRGTPNGASRPSTTDQRVADVLALKTLYANENPQNGTTP